jgi:SagB-type dehydrogenase family enzyme
VKLRHRFTADVHTVHRDGTRLTLDIPAWKALAFAVPTTGVADALVALHGEGATLDDLRATARSGGEPPAGRGIDYYLERMRRARLLEWVAADHGGELVRIESLTAGYGPSDEAVPTGPVRLSRFAYLRRLDDDLVLESPEAPCRLTLRAGAFDGLRVLGGGHNPADSPLLTVLWQAGFTEPADGDEPPDRAVWEFHDRLFHVASRGGRDRVAVGGTYRFKGRFPAPPAIKPPATAERIALPSVDVARIGKHSDSLAALMDRRRSLRDFGATPLSLEQLSEFLYRVARITRTLDGGEQELMSRPFPSGGSIYETEFYLAIGACEGVPRGLYNYRGQEHALEPLPHTADAADRLRRDSGIAMGQPERPPHVLVILTSRFPRFAWKYEAMAYRLTVMNAGVAIQTMYLVATDMGLAGCANGSGNSALFAAATGLDPLTETSVAEFALGARDPAPDG